jgi:hypothetical protein
MKGNKGMSRSGRTQKIHSHVYLDLSVNILNKLATALSRFKKPDPGHETRPCTSLTSTPSIQQNALIAKYLIQGVSRPCLADQQKGKLLGMNTERKSGYIAAKRIWP